MSIISKKPFLYSSILGKLRRMIHKDKINVPVPDFYIDIYVPKSVQILLLYTTNDYTHINNFNVGIMGQDLIYIIIDNEKHLFSFKCAEYFVKRLMFCLQKPDDYIIEFIGSLKRYGTEQILINYYVSWYNNYFNPKLDTMYNCIILKSIEDIIM